MPCAPGLSSGTTTATATATAGQTTATAGQTTANAGQTTAAWCLGWWLRSRRCSAFA
jgi:hypothetical protein